ncbi:hypothetical protein [uncultured Rubinisphaera sp.]|uniref:hypothetical protein n=1 Tax=uncultured Rubinisphaera sp. TaxID=1678686 RepID=UPI0030DBEBFF
MNQAVVEKQANPTASKKHALPFYLAILLGICWLIALAVLSLFTANPVTLNRVQIMRADAVIAAEIVDTQGKVRVVEVLFTRQGVDVETESTFKVLPPSPHWQPHVQRILPILRDADGNWRIAPAPLPKTVEIDYPDRPDLRAEVKEIVATLPR